MGHLETLTCLAAFSPPMWGHRDTPFPRIHVCAWSPGIQTSKDMGTSPLMHAHRGITDTHTCGTQRRSLPVDQLKCTERDCVEGPSSPQCRITGTPPRAIPGFPKWAHVQGHREHAKAHEGQPALGTSMGASPPWGHAHTHTHSPWPPQDTERCGPLPWGNLGGEEVSDTSTAAAPTLHRHIRKAPPPLLHRPQAETRGHTAQRPPPRHPGPPPPPATPSRVAHRPLPLTAPLSDTPSPPP